MRAIGLIALQLVIAFSATAVALPAVLVHVPALRTSGAGPVVGLGLMAAVFLLLRLIWPRPKRAES